MSPFVNAGENDHLLVKPTIKKTSEAQNHTPDPPEKG